ncbi:MAG: 3,4-dihydroxy-2-butanone-4-phosphate synthase [Alphaproteobacteria bacterium]|nr:3,4-dihydroxy-2-butanone-4-phosphate synthase [Alphaproteobacteria bacterium]
MTDAHQVMDPDALRRVELALQDLRQGRMIILVDDEDRENEGDLVLAGQHCTPEAINFMATHARGLICLSLTGAQVDKLALPMMATHNQSAYNTAFTVSIEAREGVSTGISAADRAHTVQVAIRPESTRYDIVTPGHIFPLRARAGGVLERVGQTEGSVDLARLAGLHPSAVICEIMNPDGTMARLPELKAFAAEHGLRICAVADIIKYRMQHERVVAPQHEGTLEIPGRGTWRVRLYAGLVTGGLHLAVWKGDLDRSATLVRVQAAPPAWTFLNADASALAGPALECLDRIAEAGRGALVLMHLGGTDSAMLERTFVRDVGGEAPPAVQPHADALRDLGAGCQILRDLGLEHLRLLTSTRRPILGVDAYGLHIDERIPLDG